MTGTGVQERRLVTILFSDLTDSTGISAGLEPEHFAELIEQIRMIANRVIPAHGGEVIRMDGDGMLCIFGYPEPHEDAGRRATEAALDMHAAMTALDGAFAPPGKQLQLHSGIHAGLVLLRVGDIVRGKYEILGDATNTAARLCDAAEPGEILVSAETLGGDHHFFLSDEGTERRLRGRTEPMRVWSVTGRADVASRYEARERAGLTPYLGRSEEGRAFQDWLAGDGSVLLLHGPAGIGKSRFLKEVSAEAARQGWAVSRGYCESYLSARPLQPFRQLVETLGDDPGSGLESGEEIAALLKGQTKSLWLIDDWQWADDASRDFLGQLIEGRKPDGLKILLASREADAGSLPDAVLLALSPFSHDEALATIEALLQSPDPFAIDRIEQAAGGSPLLIEELCHSFRSGNAAPLHDPREAWFDQAVQSRFDKLARPEKDLLKLSAVIGHMLPVWLIEALIGMKLDQATLNRLQDADFLFPHEAGEVYRFKHGLTRDAIYAAIGFAEKRALHEEILSALEDEVETRDRAMLLDGLAYHAVAAGNAAKGLAFAVEAGDSALAAGALDRAQAHYEAGFGLVRSLPDGPEKRDWAWAFLNKYGLACVVDPAPDQLEVLEQIEAVLAVSGSARDRMRSSYWLGLIADGVGFGKQSVKHLERARFIAPKACNDSDMQLLTTKLAHSLFTSGRNQEAVALFERQLPLIRNAGGRNSREVGSYAYGCYAFLNADRGMFERTEELFLDADAVLSSKLSSTNVSLSLFRASALVLRGDWSNAIETSKLVSALSHRSRSRMQNLKSRAQFAYSRWKLSGEPEAVRALEEIAERFQTPNQSLQYVSLVYGWLVEAAVDLYEIRLARTYMGKIIERIRSAGDRIGEAMGWRAMARLAQTEGDQRRADRYLGFARRSASLRLSRREAAHNMVCEAHLLRARGQGEAAHHLLETAEREFTAMDMPFFAQEAQALTSR